MKPRKEGERPVNFPRPETPIPVAGKGLSQSVLRGQWDKDGWGEIDHDRWMLAVMMGDVGSCRKCGKPLIADTPELNRDGTYDYEARCSDTWGSVVQADTQTRHVWGCPGMIVAPRGRVLRGSSGYRERSRRLARD